MQTIDTIPASEDVAYGAPVVSELGTVTEATLGHAGANNPDDTQYYSNW
ncbi:hypothetical protein ACFYXM_10650 [Streptomyces sp. NPDC002476]